MDFRKKLSQLYHFCWFFSFAFLCLFIYRYSPAAAPRICYPVMGFCALGLLLYLYRRFQGCIQGMCKSSFRLLIAGFFLVHFLLLLAAAKAMNIAPFSDTGSIWFSAADIVENGIVSNTIDEYAVSAWTTGTANHDYLLIYPNSQFMVFALVPFCRFLSGVLGISLRTPAAYLCASVGNICLILISEFLLFLAAKKVKGQACGLLALLLCFVFLPFYLHAFKLYSDTMSMPFVTCVICCLVYAEKSTSSRTRLLLFLCAGIAEGVGILLKGSVIILTVAVLIYIFVSGYPWKRAAVHGAAFLACILAVNLAWSAYSKDLSWLDQTNKDRFELPLTHWIMMASIRNGGYNGSDVSYSLSFETLEERSAATIATYLERVRDQGAVEYGKFLVKKITTNMADGLYIQKSHLGHFADMPVGKFVVKTAACFRPIEAYCAGFVWIFYWTFLASAFLGIREDNGIRYLINICMLGIVLFFSLWEFKSRYLLDYVPMFMLSTVLVIDRFSMINLSELPAKFHFSTR